MTIKALQVKDYNRYAMQRFTQNWDKAPQGQKPQQFLYGFYNDRTGNFRTTGYVAYDHNIIDIAILRPTKKQAIADFKEALAKYYPSKYDLLLKGGK